MRCLFKRVIEKETQEAEEEEKEEGTCTEAEPVHNTHSHHSTNKVQQQCNLRNPRQTCMVAN